MLTSLHLLVVFGHVVWPDGAQELDVVVTMKLSHFLCCGLVGALRMTQGRTIDMMNIWAIPRDVHYNPDPIFQCLRGCHIKSKEVIMMK